MFINGSYTIVIGECGYREALYGLGLSYGVTSFVPFEQFHAGSKEFARMVSVAYKLKNRGLGENKFLESMQVWIDVSAPRFWWQEFDTYRIVTKQSESTMHTLMQNQLTTENFYKGAISKDTLSKLNELIVWYNSKHTVSESNSILLHIKSILPEGFLQTRIVNTNYKTLQNMYNQRKNHKIIIWHDFFESLKLQLHHPELIFLGDKDGS